MTIEALGAIPKLETDTVQRVLMFVLNGLNPAMRGNHDHKVCYVHKLITICSPCRTKLPIYFFLEVISIMI